MTRINPEAFIDVVRHSKGKIGYYQYWIMQGYHPSTRSADLIAIFLIKEQTTSLTQRMEARRKNKDCTNFIMADCQ